MTVPPPTPNRPLKAPARIPITASRIVRLRGHGAILDPCAGSDRDRDAPSRRSRRCAPIRSRAAVLLDLDGTLAPIVARPEDAAIPERVRERSGRIAERYALTAIVTGRRGLGRAARSSASTGSPTPATTASSCCARAPRRPEPAPALAGHADDAAALRRRPRPQRLERAGLRLEDKGPIVALHWRGAADEDAAERRPSALARRGRGGGARRPPRPQGARDPPAGRDRQGRRRRGPARGAGVGAALYAGDDRTDLDAFRALGAAARRRASSSAIVRVGVRSDGGPGRAGRREPTSSSPAPTSVPDLLEALARLMQYKDLLRGTVLLTASAATALAAISAVAINSEGDDTLAALALGWWVVAIGVGIWLGRPVARGEPCWRGPLAAAKTVDPAPLRVAGPDRLRPALADRPLRRSSPARSAPFVPQVPAIATGFALGVAAAWRSREAAVTRSRSATG